MHPGFVPQNHPNQQKRRGVADDIDDRETPDCVYGPLHGEFAFTLDGAASHQNTKAVRYCTLDGFWIKNSAGGHEQLETGSGLTYSWAGERVFVNPPFSVLRPWVEKAWDDAASVACVLLPNNRQEQPFWQDLVEPYRDQPGSILRARFLRKRRPFLHRGEGIGNRTSKNPPFGLVVLVWDRRSPLNARPTIEPQ